MKTEFRQAQDRDFVAQLIRKNMEPYYRKLRISWDQELFDKNWDAFENYEMFFDFTLVGALRLSHDDLAYYIRDLQVVHCWQGKGMGTKAIEYAAEIARSAGLDRLRLRVFCINPAVSLYQRMGFRIIKTEGDLHYMEWEIS